MRLSSLQFVGQEERRGSDTVFSTIENNDQSAGVSSAINYFCLDEFWRIKLGMYIIMNNTRLRSESFV